MIIIESNHIIEQIAQKKINNWMEKTTSNYRTHSMKEEKKACVGDKFKRMRKRNSFKQSKKLFTIALLSRKMPVK